MTFLAIFLACSGSLCLGFGIGHRLGYSWGHVDACGEWLGYLYPALGTESAVGVSWEALVIREGQERPYDWADE